MKWILHILVGLVLCFPTNQIQAQQNKKDLVEPSQLELSDSKREEIQRYFGYETLILRYITAPFDITMNINERGNFLDVGFLYLLILPILLLLYFKDDKIFSIILMVSMALMLLFSMANSIIYDGQKSRIIENKNGQIRGKADISFTEDPIGATTVGIYKINNAIYKPFKSVISTVSGEKDYFTYPFVFSFFALFCYFILKRLNTDRSSPKKILAFVLLIYSFLWYLLSSGIIWYGYLMLLLGLALMVVLIKGLDASLLINKVVKNAFYGLASIWILVAFVNRVSNISPSVPTQHQGKNMFNYSFFRYAAGNLNYEQTMEALYPNLNDAVKYINRYENSLVYRVGTSFTYFIEDNNNRVFIDNQLGFFKNLMTKYNDVRSITKALKASGFKFIIIDLYTPTIDRTPEQTLTEKYKLFMNWIYTCETQEIMILRGTDRVLNNEGQGGTKFGVFGDIANNGSYAIYEIK